KDDILKYAQLLESKNGETSPWKLKKGRIALIPSSSYDPKIICLEKQGLQDAIYFGNADFAIIGETEYIGDKFWMQKPMNYYLVSFKDNNRKLICTGRCYEFSFSPGGNNIVYFDYDKSEFFSYSLQSCETKNITDPITTPITR